MSTRRSVLIGAGVLAGSSLAGCTGLVGSDGPEDAVETYITAGNEGDLEAANGALHPESTLHPLEESDLPDEETELSEVAEASLEDAVRWQAESLGQELDGEDLEEAVNQQRESIETEIEDLDVDEYTFVRVQFAVDSPDDEVYVLVLKDDGEWFVYF